MTEHGSRSSDGHADIVRADLHRRLYELSAIAVFRSTLDGRYIVANPAGVRMHGYDSEDELLQAVRNIGADVYVHPENRETMRRLLEEQGSVEGFECEIYRHKTKEPIWVRQNVYLVMDETGQPRYLDGHIEDITESKRVEAALRQARNQLAAKVEGSAAALKDSEEKYRNLVDGSVQGVMVHQDQRIAYANAAAAKIHGYDLGTMIGLPVQRLFPDHEQARISAYRERQGEDHIEFQVIRPNGELVWVEGFAQNIHWDGAPARQNTFINIDVRRKAQDALAASERLFRSVIDHAPASIVLKDDQGRIELVNRNYEEIFDTSAESVLGKTSADIYAPEFAARLDANDQKVIKTGEVSIEEIRVTQPEIPVEFLRITKFPVFDRFGKISGIGTFATDISVEKAAEERLIQSQKMEAVGQLTGGVAHDFNNMLAAIIGNLELIQDGRMDAEADRESINIALKAAHSGAELTHRLLAFSRQQELDAKVVEI
ncbi:MAG: PAS domain S-box protein, partial [Rhodospirillaceae bacterium]|nr:PAS domain S-box protein [Rhodospirillaceae bacterium]